MAITTNTADGEAIVEINTTPLIDVMLVLLTLLIITLPLQTDAVKIDLSRNHRPPKVMPPVDIVQIDFDGTTSWNGTRVDRATLDAYLTLAAADDPQPEIHVSASRLAKYDAVAQVLTDAARAGATRIGFTDMERY